MKLNFVALDLETATSYRGSICQIGITEVVDGVPQKPKSWLVRPEGNEYDEWNIWIHGITSKDTENSPSFDVVWKEVEPYIEGKIVTYRSFCRIKSSKTLVFTVGFALQAA